VLTKFCCIASSDCHISGLARTHDFLEKLSDFRPNCASEPNGSKKNALRKKSLFVQFALFVLHRSSNSNNNNNNSSRSCISSRKAGSATDIIVKKRVAKK